MEKWLILGLGQGMCQMNLELLLRSKSKEILKKKKNNQGMSQGHRYHPKELAQQPTLKEREQKKCSIRVEVEV